MVVIGIAPLEFLPIKKKFRIKPDPRIIEGNRIAVRKAHLLGLSPFSVLSENHYYWKKIVE